MMTIHVTAEDIAAGKRRNCQWCPLALAIRRQAGQGRSVIVGHGTVQIVHFGRSVAWSVTTYLMQRWLSRFDNGETVEPTTFRMRLTPRKETPGA